MKGSAPGSWKMIVTMSFPMCLFLSSWYMGNRQGEGYRSAWLTGRAWTITAVSSLSPCSHGLAPSCSQREPWTPERDYLPPCSESCGSVSLRVKDKVPTWPREIHTTGPVTSLTSPPTSPLAHTAPAALPSCRSSNSPETLPPRGLRTGCSLCLERSSCRSPHSSLPPSFRS